ncbi:WhiB family transcriptional regulator [Streptomyces alboflavus]|uniref:WhiB family transcriptional regulator n=1 Tax=Streptomyces alboflavus TaxID=67267 RepID=UPI0013318425|nr:WhiB family transcriptional regulator [Streptomyces alboflavus]
MGQSPTFINFSPSLNSAVQSALKEDWDPLLEAAGTSGRQWEDNAPCASYSSDLFFPEVEHPWSDPEQIRRDHSSSLREPLSVCASCPLSVSARCLVESLRQEDKYGIRAGLLASERRALLTAWKSRIDSEAVSAALRGVPTALTSLEREEALSRLSADPSLNTDAAARGMAVSSKYLFQLLRDHQQHLCDIADPIHASIGGASDE